MPETSSIFVYGVSRAMRQCLLEAICLAGIWGMLSACVAGSGGATSEEIGTSDTAATARALAEKAVVQPVAYENARQQGPPLVVLPGQFKSLNATFTQKFTPNNIADFAELELDKANFRVLERAHLGPLLQEVVLAVNMGDPEGLKKFRKGKFTTTRWFLQFDVLRAEPVAEAGTEFDGKAIGDIVTVLAGDNIGGRAAGSLISSVGGSEDAKVWIIGLRYKIIDAVDSSIVKTSYIEDKMEVGGSSASFLGVSKTEQGGMTIDSMVQRLVQKCVAEIDRDKGTPSAVAGQSNPPQVTMPEKTGELIAASYKEEVGGERPRTPVKKSETQKEKVLDSNPDCQELRKNWQLGDSSVMQRYLKECAQ